MAAIGRMRERVTIQQKSKTADDGGGFALSWTELATVWARVTPAAGRERLEAMRLESAIPYTITIRYREDVAADMRVLWGTKTMNIRAISNPDEKQRFTELLCDEGEAT